MIGTPVRAGASPASATGRSNVGGGAAATRSRASSAGGRTVGDPPSTTGRSVQGGSRTFRHRYLAWRVRPRRLRDLRPARPSQIWFSELNLEMSDRIAAGSLAAPWWKERRRWTTANWQGAFLYAGMDDRRAGRRICAAHRRAQARPASHAGRDVDRRRSRRLVSWIETWLVARTVAIVSPAAPQGVVHRRWWRRRPSKHSCATTAPIRPDRRPWTFTEADDGSFERCGARARVQYQAMLSGGSGQNWFAHRQSMSRSPPPNFMEKLAAARTDPRDLDLPLPPTSIRITFVRSSTVGARLAFRGGAPTLSSRSPRLARAQPRLRGPVVPVQGDPARDYVRRQVVQSSTGPPSSATRWTTSRGCRFARGFTPRHFGVRGTGPPS